VLGERTLVSYLALYMIMMGYCGTTALCHPVGQGLCVQSDLRSSLALPARCSLTAEQSMQMCCLIPEKDWAGIAHPCDVETLACRTGWQDVLYKKRHTWVGTRARPLQTY
jgi:hypothetical protein